MLDTAAKLNFGLGDGSLNKSSSLEKVSSNMGKIASGVVTGLVIFEGIKKGIDKLVEASPRLQATLVIFSKSMQLILRPIGDFISLILRPLAMLMLRKALEVYSTTSEALEKPGAKTGGLMGGIGGVVAGGAIGFAAGGALGLSGGPLALITGVLGAIVGCIGALVGINVGAKIGEWIEQINNFFTNLDWSELWSGIIDFFINVVPGWRAILMEAVGVFFMETLPGLMMEMTETLITFFTETIPFAIGLMIGSLVTFFIEDIPRLISQLWDNLKIFFQNIWLSFKEVWENIKKFITETLPQLIIDKWDAIKTFFKNLPENIVKAFDAIKTFFIETIPDWFDTAIQSIKDIWSTIGNSFRSGYNSGRDSSEEKEKGSLAIGGYINQSGLYRLHSGEVVLSPTQTSSMNFSPNISIKASINSEMDIRNLANKLVSLMQEGLTRKSNYLMR